MTPDGDDASKERLRLWLRALKSTRVIETRLREKFRTEFSTTLPRFDVMAALSRYEAGLKMSELSGVLRVSNGNVTGIVDRLEEDGLLIRVPVPGDRRASRVKLTDKGRAAFDRQAAAHESWINEVFAAFTADEARTLSIRFSALDTETLREEAPT